MGPGLPGPLAPPMNTHHLSAHTVHGAHMTHPPSLAASPTTSTDKIRKKSAHWADSDTDKLLEVLLRHREKGRTADNGFEPEVWQEAAKCLESTNGTGGEKTPDACRSRWQRLQREFKFARQYLEECHGFSWDRNKHKLYASEESWAAAERKGHQTKKGRKIYLPWFQGLGQLCPSDSRIRPTKGRMPSNGSSTSETSGALPPATLAHNVVRPPGLPDGTHVMPHINGHGQPQSHTGVQPGMPVPDQASVWGDGGDSSLDDVDSSFTLADPNQQPFAMSHQKRPLEYDVSVLASGGDRKRIRTHREPQGTPTRPSTTNVGQPLGYQQLVPPPSTTPNVSHPHPPQTPPHHAHQHHYSTPQVPQKQVQHMQSHQQPHQQQHQPHQQQQPQQAHQTQPQQQPLHAQVQQHTIQHPPQLIAQQPQQHSIAPRQALAPQAINTQFSPPYNIQSAYTTRSPQYTPSINDPALPSPVYQSLPVGSGDMSNTFLRTPQQTTDTRRDAVIKRTESRALGPAASMPNLASGTHARSKSSNNIIMPSTTTTGGLALSGLTPKTAGMSFSPGGELQSLTTPANQPTKSGVSTGRNTPGPGSPELDAGARRIDAVRRLQLEDISDDDLMLILPEFEQSNAVVETYLGLQREHLRVRWLQEKVMARRRLGVHTRRADEFESGM
ncbi:hypothetical protein CC85DRAFT_285428 [Cutaneotrichosporon oleaginosum]|uniref:Myb-like domain-containing protein n=1 Tax=Cutaneotrichosporon oleaginosum TaxID=879819 RepID=A0A0J1B4E1_9TREE|nr:uncharacterized protein CC85DRAFT_285428 [Cutaneotrichosporon oleaginosum]KLT42519.1 hypothetical protein CC85DRAFT_285428 [Cutaneotrichosporon oleaginosum]TXT07791.1 hypothetical protein COLE_04715 [Cutaneotrichosporon oleaginosum]